MQQDPEQLRTRFERDGFVVLRRYFDEPAIDPLRAAAHRLVRELAPRDDQEGKDTPVFRTDDRDRGRDARFFASAQGVQCFLEDAALDPDGRLRVPPSRAVNKIGHALHDHVPEFTAFCRRSEWRHLLGALGQSDPLLWQSMLIFKQPGIGGEVGWHQDATWLGTRPGHDGGGVIGAWLALEDADRNNGCLRVLPGLHRGPLRERYAVDWDTQRGHREALDDTPWPSLDRGRVLELPAGSLVLFSDRLPHASTANRSPRSRLALTLHFADASCRWLADNWLQRPDLPPFRP